MTRHGKTLVELLVVISVFGAIMAPIGRLLHTIMRSEREGAHALAASTIGSRLAREFRSDVRSARDVELLGGKGELELTLDDGKAVTYRLGDEGIQRAMTEGDKTLSRDSFRLPPGTTRFEISDEPPLVVLLHARHSSGAHPNPSDGSLVLRIEAAPGRDHRFEN